MILFLDFDGVLHPHLRHEPDFCRNELLWQILHTCPDTQVVFSTSWRDSYKFDEMIEFVTCGGGEDLQHRIIGSIPNLEKEGLYGRRDLEIQSWIDTNDYAEQWLAIDDVPDLFNGGHPNLYIVNGNRGLTDADVSAIIGRIQLQLGKEAFTVEDIQRDIVALENLGVQPVP